MSLQTPVKIRMRQRKLYRKAKQEPRYRFYLLYDKISREDILAHAYALAKANGGAPGVDGQTFSEIEAAGIEKWLAEIGNELREKRYQPAPVRRVMFRSPMAASERSGYRRYGTGWYRRRPSCWWSRFSKRIWNQTPTAIGRGAALKERSRKYNDSYAQAIWKWWTQTCPSTSIPFRTASYLQCVARRIVDRDMLRLIKLWLKTPVEERDEKGNRRLTGGRHSACGTPQGGVISPLLANLYMNRFLKYWRQSGRSEAFLAHVINYADDFVILSRGHAAEALEWTRRVMAKLGLTINEAKTSLRNAWREEFHFLGYTFGRLRHFRDGYWYFGARPSQKSISRLRSKVGDLLRRSNLQPWPEVRDQLNQILPGCGRTFAAGCAPKRFG